jgi:hypothetical protein
MARTLREVGASFVVRDPVPDGSTAFSARDGGLYAAQGDYKSGGIAIAATVLVLWH